jgi:small multidrug resistance family-3 protein
MGQGRMSLSGMLEKMENRIRNEKSFDVPCEYRQMIFQSLLLFLTAGLCEIGGGYLIWLWIREGRGFEYALLGVVILVLYGIIPTLQTENFGRVYAAYGGIFIILSLLWGWQIDKVTPDQFDIIGAAIALVGVSVIMYWPRIGVPA